ncbi:MAG: ribonuclease HII [Desulfovibrio sp.]|uniref:ribonuclease HII n=1 Tax=Desulfovibrio sp. 7SRBS1 TaxID=3378064 RepID=UPI003B4077A6
MADLLTSPLSGAAEAAVPPELTAGIDEAGRGCLAGPVVAAAVILPAAYDLPGLTDSKKVPEAKRGILAAAIKEQAVSWALGVAWPEEIDRINILQATMRAMARASEQLKSRPALLLVDGNRTFSSPIAQRAIVGGDLSQPCISAASIIAKTFRDKLMAALDRRYPGYGLTKHKGYGTREHMEAIERLGPCRVHRVTFRGVRTEREVAICLPGI